MRPPAAWIALAAALPLAALAPTALIAARPAPAAGASDPFHLVLFSAPDRRVAAVGDVVVLTVEGVAAPDHVAADAALARAFAAWSVGEAADWEVAGMEPPTARRAADGSAVEWTRRLRLRARRAGTLAVPPLTLRAAWGAATRTWTTAPHLVTVYRRDGGVRAAARSVVPLVVEGVSEGRPFRRIGSGWLAADDALVTAFHVVVDASRVRVTLPGGRRLTLRSAWSLDPARDVAVLALDPAAVARAGLVPLPLAPDATSGRGVTFTAGWPGGVQDPTVAARYVDLPLHGGGRLAVSANRVRPGDSGGPLLDAAGRVLGVVASGRSADGDPDLLREDLCLAADPRPALARRAERPVGLRRALAEAARTAPQAQAHRAAAVLLRGGTAPAAAARQRAQLLDAARAAPHDPVLLFLAGSVLEALGEGDRAASAYEAALGAPPGGAGGAHRPIEPGYFPATYALAYHHYRRGAWARAESLFAATRAAAPYARLGALGLAQVRIQRLRYAEAVAAADEVLAREPAFGPALFMLGWAHLAAGRTAEARALAFRLDPIGAGWAARLRQAIEQPVLGPPALAPMPRAAPAREPLAGARRRVVF